jgi:hypothetical protein
MMTLWMRSISFLGNYFVHGINLIYKIISNACFWNWKWCFANGFKFPIMMNIYMQLKMCTEHVGVCYLKLKTIYIL